MATTREGDGNTARFRTGYDLGSIGTWLRLLFGVVAPLSFIIPELRFQSADWLSEVGIHLVAITVAYFVAHYALGERFLARVNPWVSTAIFYGPVLVLPYIRAVPVAFRFAMTVYIALSLVVVVFIRYGGCEVLGIPSLLLRRRYVVYCPWNAVDVADKAIADSRWSGWLQGWAPKVTAGLAMTIVFFSSPWPYAFVTTAVAAAVVLGVWGLVRSRRETEQE